MLKETTSTLLCCQFTFPYFKVIGISCCRNKEHSECGNAGKYGPEKTPYLETFHAVEL